MPASSTSLEELKPELYLPSCFEQFTANLGKPR